MSKSKGIKDIDVYLITIKNTHLFRNPDVFMSTQLYGDNTSVRRDILILKAILAV